MTYYLLGSGNMAHFLAQRMNGAGHVCVGIWGRDHEAAARLAKRYHFPLLSGDGDVHDGPDVCLLAVSDNSIEALAMKLRLGTTALIHFGGSVSIGKLATGAAQYGVVWPLYSIRKDALPVSRKFPCIIEASDERTIGIVREVGRAISDETVQLSGEQRQWLHTAAVLSNNFTTYLLGIAERICLEHSIPFSLLQPILSQLVKNIETRSPQLLQTGPARRNDVETMSRHLVMMAAKPHWQEVYKALSAAISKDFSAPGGSH